MSSAISGYISQIQNAVYGEQVRSAIISALEACYSDVENPDLQSEAFITAINEAYASGILDITEVTQVSQMTNENIIYRYMGTETGYLANTLYYYNGTKWTPIGSEFDTVTLPIEDWCYGSVNALGEIATNPNTRAVTIFEIPLKVGDIVKFSASSDYRMSVIEVAASSGVNSGWKQTDYTIIKTANYRIQFAPTSDAFSVDTITTAIDSVKIETSSVDAGYLEDTAFRKNRQNLFSISDTQPGHMNGSGVIVASEGTPTKTTGFIPAKAATAYIIDLIWNEDADLAPWVTWAFFNSEKTIIGTRAGGNFSYFRNESDSPELKRVFTTPANTAYMRISYREYSGGSIVLTEAINDYAITPSVKDFNEIKKIQHNPAPISIKFPFKSVAHQGCSDNGIPFNTLPAFKRAKQLGFEIFECDVQQLADGNFAIRHDDTMTIDGSSANLQTLTLEQVQSVTVGTGDYAGTVVPTLQQTLNLARCLGMYVYLELKQTFTVSAIESVVNIVKEYGMESRVTWISKSFLNLSNLEQYDPMARVGLVGETSGSAALASCLKNGKNEVFLDIRSTAIGTTPTQCKSLGIGLEVWPVDTSDAVLALDPYITGTTGAVNSSKILYDANIVLP